MADDLDLISREQPVAKNAGTPAERFRMTLALFEVGEAMLRQKLRRTHPEASAEEISGFVREWLERRPGAEHGDAVGRPVEWPRRR